MYFTPSLVLGPYRGQAYTIYFFKFVCKEWPRSKCQQTRKCVQLGLSKTAKSISENLQNVLENSTWSQKSTDDMKPARAETTFLTLLVHFQNGKTLSSWYFNLMESKPSPSTHQLNSKHDYDMIWLKSIQTNPLMISANHNVWSWEMPSFGLKSHSIAHYIFKIE